MAIYERKTNNFADLPWTKIRDIYKFYEFLSSKGLNILNEENILKSNPTYYSDSSYSYHLSLVNLFYLFQVADFFKTLDMEKYNLKISIETIQKPKLFLDIKDGILTKLLNKNYETKVDKIYDNNYFSRLIAYKLNEMHESSVTTNEDNIILGDDILSILDYFNNLSDDEFNNEIINFNTVIEEENNDINFNYIDRCKEKVKELK